MANELEKSITVHDAIRMIDGGDLLLPSIQRRFVWTTDQIEFLFDSIMQDYPINTFMFWEVNEDALKDNFRFYSFLRKYIEYKGGNNEHLVTKGYKNFRAVIDGQQRLNSLYLGLKGSYAMKQYVYRKRNYKENEEDFPSRKLFLDLLNPLEDNEQKKVYDFRFLIHNEHKNEGLEKIKQTESVNGQLVETDCFWFPMEEVLGFKDEEDVITYLEEQGLSVKGYTRKTLLRLYKLINEKPIINFYLEKEQEFDKVLYEFIRTNSGGTTLSFADLLMSIITASWESGSTNDGAREKIDALIKEVGGMGFGVNQDFVLKTCLVLFSDDIRFSLKNFDANLIERIRVKWSEISLSIKSCFELIKSLSFTNQALRAKNAAIPIIYYLYKTDAFRTINKDNEHVENRRLIKRFLHITLLKKSFGGSSDGFLKKLKNVLDKNLQGDFPFVAIREDLSGGNRSLSMDEERIASVLRTSYDSLDSFYVLSLLFPNFNFEFKNPNLDHLHPKSSFNQDAYDTLEGEELEFYQKHWNTVLNLALLSEEQNKSKNSSALKPWIEEQEKHNKGIRNELYIPENIDLDWSNFKEFIEKREELLTHLIRENIE
ncbi:DUF262 domain-containing protein [Reichenbachiella sp.]|uniref:DUF262 domain-containing protein n=1 Tax=Reichenbachiella sp. TaxID=2184521 RepID=UPI003B5B55DF